MCDDPSVSTDKDTGQTKNPARYSVLPRFNNQTWPWSIPPTIPGKPRPAEGETKGKRERPTPKKRQKLSPNMFGSDRKSIPNWNWRWCFIVGPFLLSGHRVNRHVASQSVVGGGMEYIRLTWHSDALFTFNLLIHRSLIFRTNRDVTVLCRIGLWYSFE